MLTVNRSLFLSTNGSLARLYHCPLMRSPPYVMNQCFDKIPKFHKNAIFVDTITRQTYPDDQVQNCSERINNLFQFDIEDENAWFTITPTLEHRKRAAVFGHEDVTPVSRRVFDGARDASTAVSILVVYSYQRCFKENFTKILWRTRRPQHSTSRIRTLFFFCSVHELLCGQHDLPHSLQKSIYGHLWINRLRFGFLWNLFFLLYVYQTYR